MPLPIPGMPGPKKTPRDKRRCPRCGENRMIERYLDEYVCGACDKRWPAEPSPPEP